jgi:hypothetical protein
MAYDSDHVELMQAQDCFALKRDGLTLILAAKSGLRATFRKLLAWQLSGIGV